MKNIMKKLNEFIPLMITVGLTVLMGLLYKIAPSLLQGFDENPYTSYYTLAEFHDIIKDMLKLFAYTGIVIALMMMLFPGAWARLEYVMRNKNYQPKWIRDLFIFSLFLVLLLALVLV